VAAVFEKCVLNCPAFRSRLALTVMFKNGLPMKINNTKYQKYVGILLLCIIVWGCYLLISKIWTILSSVDPNLGAGLIVASATILVSVLSLIFSKKQEQKVEIESQLREKKIPTYEGIINFIFRITFAEKVGKKQPTEKEMIQFFTDTTRDLVVWGSHDMIRAFTKFREELARLSNNNNESSEMLICVENLLIAIRIDLGHKHKRIKRGEILRLYVNDIPDNF